MGGLPGSTPGDALGNPAETKGGSMATSISHVPHVPREDDQRVFDLRISQGNSTGYLLGIVEAEQEGITEVFLQTGYAVFDHIGQSLGEVDPVTADRSAQWLIREDKKPAEQREPFEVLIAWRRVYYYSDNSSFTVEDAVAKAKEAMIDDAVMKQDDMDFLQSLRGDGYWEVTVNGEVVEESKE